MSVGTPRSVLVVSGVRGDTRRYRAFHLVEQLHLCGVDARFVHLTDFHFTKTVDSRAWDLVVLHRTPYPEYLGGIIERLKRRGALVLSDFDDLLFDPAVFQFINSPDFADSVRSDLYQESMYKTRQILAYSDGAIVSTSFLADQISQLNKPVWVHRNAFSLEMFRICTEVNAAERSREVGRIVIGYASGTPTHNRDFEMIWPALSRVMEKYPQVELRIIGPLDPGGGWGAAGDRITRLKLVPWRRLPWLLKEFDINLAPLVVDNPFAQSKSEIKYMEAAMVGVPTVASPTDAFTYAIQSGENGFLANTQEDWFNRLSALVEDSLLRERMGKRTYEGVMEKYHPAARAVELARQLDDIYQNLRGKTFCEEFFPTPTFIKICVQDVLQGKRWIAERHEKAPSYIEMGLFNLRAAGFLKTLKLVWVFFRRLISPVIPFTMVERK